MLSVARSARQYHVIPLKSLNGLAQNMSQAVCRATRSYAGGALADGKPKKVLAVLYKAGDLDQHQFISIKLYAEQSRADRREYAAAAALYSCYRARLHTNCCRMCVQYTIAWIGAWIWQGQLLCNLAAHPGRRCRKTATSIAGLCGERAGIAGMAGESGLQG